MSDQYFENRGHEEPRDKVSNKEASTEVRLESTRIKLTDESVSPNFNPIKAERFKFNLEQIVKLAKGLYYVERGLKANLLSEIHQCILSDSTGQSHNGLIEEPIVEAVQELSDLHSEIPELLSLLCVQAWDGFRSNSPIAEEPRRMPVLTFWWKLRGVVEQGASIPLKEMNNRAIDIVKVVSPPQKPLPTSLGDKERLSEQQERFQIVVEKFVGVLKRIYALDDLIAAASKPQSLSDVKHLKEKRGAAHSNGLYRREIAQIHSLLVPDRVSTTEIWSSACHLLQSERRRGVSTVSSQANLIEEGDASKKKVSDSALPFVAVSCSERLLEKVGNTIERKLRTESWEPKRQKAEGNVESGTPLGVKQLRISQLTPILQELGSWEVATLDRFTTVRSSLATLTKQIRDRLITTELDRRYFELIAEFQSVNIAELIAERLDPSTAKGVVDEFANRLRVVCERGQVGDDNLERLIDIYADFAATRDYVEHSPREVLREKNLTEGVRSVAELAFHYADFHNSWKSLHSWATYNNSEYWRDRVGMDSIGSSISAECRLLDVEAIDSCSMTFSAQGYPEQKMQLPFERVSVNGWNDYLNVALFAREISKLVELNDSLVRLEERCRRLVREAGVEPLVPQILTGEEVTPYIADIVRIEASLHRTPGDPDIEEHGVVLQLETWDGNKELFEEGAKLAVIVEGEALKAYCIYCDYRPEWFTFESNLDPRKTGVIVMMYSAPDVAERGAADALFNAVGNDAQLAGVTGLVGQVEHTNARALAFWQKQGWVVQGEHISSKDPSKTKGGVNVGYYLDMHFPLDVRVRLSNREGTAQRLTANLEVELGRRRHYRNNVMKRLPIDAESDVLTTKKAVAGAVCLSFDDSDKDFIARVLPEQAEERFLRLSCEHALGGEETRRENSSSTEVAVKVKGAGLFTALAEKIQRCYSASKFSELGMGPSFLLVSRAGDVTGETVGEVLEWLNSGIDVVLVGNRESVLERFIAEGRVNHALDYTKMGRILLIDSPEAVLDEIERFISGDSTKMIESSAVYESLTRFRGEGLGHWPELSLEVRLLASARAGKGAVPDMGDMLNMSLQMNTLETNADLNHKQLEAIYRAIGFNIGQQGDRESELLWLEARKFLDFLLRLSVDFQSDEGVARVSALPKAPQDMPMLFQEPSAERTFALARILVNRIANEIYLKAFAFDMKFNIYQFLCRRATGGVSSADVSSFDWAANGNFTSIRDLEEWPLSSEVIDFIGKLGSLDSAEKDRLMLMGDWVAHLVIASDVYVNFASYP